jgi:fatty-acyl-CoA synthase
MKLAFSTVGCPDWSFDEIFASAKDLGYDAIEIRGIGNEIYAPRLKIFGDSHIDATIKKLSGANLPIAMFASNAVVGFAELANEGLCEALEYIKLAKKTATPFVRILISPQPYPEKIDMDLAVSIYSELCENAENSGVTPVVETNGVFADSKTLSEFMKKIKSENKGVLWDINHPVRYFGESAEQTFGNIGKYVKYLHIKDSVFDQKTKKIEYRMPGYGDLPVREIIKLIAGAGYGGVLSLEWTKRWQPELQEPGIVFSHYVNYMRQITNI